MTAPISNFANYAKFLDYVEHTAPTWSCPASERIDHNGDPWSGTETFDNAMTLARNGWPEGREFLTTIKQDTIALPNDMTMVPARSLDVVGAYPEIGLALSGDPEHMVTIEPIPAPSPILRIGVSIARESGLTIDTIMGYGGIIVSYIDALELAGWRCELVICMDINGGAKPWHGEVMVKQAEDAPDKDRILFAIAHPSMSRRLFFKLMETIPSLENDYSSDYGSPITGPSDNFDILTPTVRSGNMLATIHKAITNGVPTNDR